MKLKSLSDLDRLLPESEEPPTIPQKNLHDGKGKTVHIFLETKGRKGKTVTIIAGLQHNPATMEEIERILKQYCGAGGTIKKGNIEIQGDQRGRAVEKMKEMNYVVKG
jgi:translation initiation factor 1